MTVWIEFHFLSLSPSFFWGEGVKIIEHKLTLVHVCMIELECWCKGLRRRHSSPYCCWSLWRISADGTFSPTRNLITMRCSTLRSTFCSLITLATPRQDWTGSNPSRRGGRGCGFTISRSHSCCALRLYTQISPGHIWTTLYYEEYVSFVTKMISNVNSTV